MTPPNSDSGKDCGGLAGIGCANGEFCNYSISAKCGAGDQSGVCTAIPQICTDIYKPVCGCDGKTYGNECEANGAGVPVASEGTCKDGEPGGKICDASNGAACADGEYCAFAPEAACGDAGKAGVCTKKPEACDLIFDPVCGCDGKTYGNACAAAQAGVSVAYTGQCKTDPGTGKMCGGIAAIQCGADEYCSYPPETNCGSGDQAGVCLKIPQACDTIFDPVCGCDGKTYDSACSAALSRTSVAYKGQCKTDPGTGKVCGGLLGSGCVTGEYCNYPADAHCGAADATGTCTAIPGGCTKEYVPVCGCNGTTYGNACMAAAAGVSVAYQGTCK